VVLAFLGAVLVGIGVIVFFAANWQYLPSGAKLVLIFLAVAAAYYCGYRLRYEREGYRGTGNALLFLGALLFGAAIFLIAQGVHINANAPSLLVMWTIGVLPLAYLLRSPAMVVLALLSAATSLGWYGADWFADASAAAILAAYLAFGVLLYALGGVQGRHESTRVHLLPYSVLGLCLMAGALLPLTFPDLANDAASGLAGAWTDVPVRFFALLAIALIAVVANAYPVSRASRESLVENSLLVLMLGVGGLIGYFGNGGGASVAVFTNLLLLVLAVGAVALGYLRQIPAWVTVGLFVFAVHVLVRYCDWFWSLLPRSGFFIGLGLALLLGGMALERTRRRVIGAMREEAQP
jgi:uncharacterized membrane protein